MAPTTDCLAPPDEIARARLSPIGAGRRCGLDFTTPSEHSAAARPVGTALAGRPAHARDALLMVRPSSATVAGAELWLMVAAKTKMLQCSIPYRA